MSKSRLLNHGFRGLDSFPLDLRLHPLARAALEPFDNCSPAIPASIAPGLTYGMCFFMSYYSSNFFSSSAIVLPSDTPPSPLT